MGLQLGTLSTVFLDGSHYVLTRFYFQRAIGLIYLIGFLILAFQFQALCGERGLLPARIFLSRIQFWDSPSLFWFHCSDFFLNVLAWIGVFLSLLAVSGISDAYGPWLSAGIWFGLWILYLSFVNVGQTFYGFGWETLLLEIGFLMIFLGPSRNTPPVIVIWLLRWVLFRVMFGAGMIKLRGDSCWRDLTCMQYHYETQPMPNPLSWYFNQLPIWIHKLAVAFNHFVEIPVPFLFFGPRPFRQFAGLTTIIFQTLLILSGNLSWLNYITIALCITCFDDSFWRALPAWPPLILDSALGSTLGSASTLAGSPPLLIYGLLGLILVLSIRPAINLFSSNQMMNASFEPLHLVNTYGAFGGITRTRYEVILEGTEDATITPTTQWKEYEFKGKPGDPGRRPPLVSPYHLHLDWQMWFAAMGPYWQHPWILNLVAKLLQNEPHVTGLLRKNPFQEHPPRYVKADLYQYEFTRFSDSASSQPRPWWKRRFVQSYLPALSLSQPQFLGILKEQGWEP